MMTDDEVFAAYVALWKKAEGLGARVEYDGLDQDCAGKFFVRPEAGRPARPTIHIFRNCYEAKLKPTRGRSDAAPEGMAPPDLCIELIILAHEFGHFVSWQSRTPRDRWLRYDAATERRGRTSRDVLTGVRERGELERFDELLRPALRDALTSDGTRA
jgi:hypothetical protein